MLSVEVRTAILPPLRVSSGQVGAGGEGGGAASILGPIVRPQVAVNGVPVAAPWGEPGDWRLFGALVGVLLAVGGWELARRFRIVRR